MTLEKGQLKNTGFTNLAEVGTTVIVNVKMTNQLERKIVQKYFRWISIEKSPL